MDISASCGCIFTVNYTSWNRDVFIREEDRFHACVSIKTICKDHDTTLKNELEQTLIDEHRKTIDTLYNKFVGGGIY